MINRIVRLINIKQFDVFHEEIAIPDDKLLIRPELLSICAADLRYYTGQRNHKVLKSKLPLSLIHEAIGTVVVDKKNIIGEDRKVVLIPNINNEKNSSIKGNYQLQSKFRSSSIDGFMQDYVIADYDRVIPIPATCEDDTVYVLSELISVAVNAVQNFRNHFSGSCKKIGVWGDGSLGYVTVIVLKHFFPDAEIIVFGHNIKKSLHFMIADKIVFFEDITENIQLDCAFECVGGKNSAHAIQQCIDIVKPQGCISLMGVSEDPIPIDTRKVLEKGLVLLGNSRSEREDFEEAIEIINKNNRIRTLLNTIISDVFEIISLEDIYSSFEHAQINDFKTIMKWRL